MKKPRIKDDPPMSLQVKLGSIAVHADELLSDDALSQDEFAGPLQLISASPTEAAEGEKP